MGRLILCYDKKANIPYHIKSMNLNIYTLEELCYFLYNNIYLIEETIIKDDLIDWIEKELQLTDLSEALKKNCGSDNNFIMTILKYTGYVSDDDMNETSKKLSIMDEQSDFDKTLAKAEHFLQNKLFLEAILEYKKFTKLEDNIQKEKIFNNMGVAYANMFLFREAAKCFHTAYEINKNERIYKQLIYAVAMLPKEDVTEFKNERIAADKELIQNELKNARMPDSNEKLIHLNEVLEYKNNNQIAKYYKGLENLLNEWKKEYINFNT